MILQLILVLLMAVTGMCAFAGLGSMAASMFLKEPRSTAAFNGGLNCLWGCLVGAIVTMLVARL